MIVGFNSLAEWVLVWNYEGYQKETFVVSGTRNETSVNGEGFNNNKVGWLTRQAYGYRDEEDLYLKIYDLPHLTTKRDL